MENGKRKGKREFWGVQIALAWLWGAQLLYTDAWYVNCLLILVAAGICFYRNIMSSPERQPETRERILVFAFSAFFTCMVAFANYELWGHQDTGFGRAFDLALQLGLTLIFFLGGFFAFRIIFLTVCRDIKKLLWEESENAYRPGAVFGICFSALALTRLIVLFGCRYPGLLSPDSLSQVEQILSGVYSNHHPFWHTMLIRCFLLSGTKLFGDINAGVAAYSVFQILLTAFCFSFALSTMAGMRAPRWIILCAALFYLLMPYHLVYAFTMWKDVPWACFVLLFAVSFLRCERGIGNVTVNAVLLFVSGIGVCLFRSNGLFVFVILTAACLLLWKLQNKKRLLLLFSVLAVSVVLKYPVLDRLQVSQPDTVEALSVPAQQIARILWDGNELDAREREVLGELLDVDAVRRAYDPYVSDPIKELVREKGNQELLRENRGKYLKLYISLGLKHPASYLRAWIDQTKGYWNAGYEGWRWLSAVWSNDFGIAQRVRSEWLRDGLEAYQWLFTEIQGLRPFLSIGLFVWIDLLMLFVAWIRKDRLGAFMTLPILAVVLSLLLATPVNGEFRYIYSAFCTLPIVICTATAVKKTES